MLKFKHWYYTRSVIYLMLKSTQSPSKKCKNMGKKQGFIYTNNEFPSPAVLLLCPKIIHRNTRSKVKLHSHIAHLGGNRWLSSLIYSTLIKSPLRLLFWARSVVMGSGLCEMKMLLESGWCNYHINQQGLTSPNLLIWGFHN